MIAALVGSRTGMMAAAGLFLVTTITAGWLAFDTSGKLKAATRQVASVTQERDKAQVALGACQTNAQNLEAAVTAQSEAVEALSRETQEKLATAEKAVQRALRGRQQAEAKAARLFAFKPNGMDQCQRFISADEIVVKELAR